MPRKQALIPTEVRNAASEDLAAERARRRAFREHVEKDQRCMDAVKAFQDATGAFWSADLKKARYLLRAVHQTLLNASRALEEAGRLEAWVQIDHERTYDGFRVRNHRVMSRPSYEWAIELFNKACAGQFSLPMLRETWETESLRDAIRWLRIFIVGLSGEGAVLPSLEDRLPTPEPAPPGPAAVRNVQEVVSDLGVVGAGQERGSLPAPRLSFDAETLTVWLDGKGYQIDEPQTFHVYRVIVESRRQITNSEIQAKVVGVKGRKAIARRLRALPPALKATIQTKTTGHWLMLPL